MLSFFDYDSFRIKLHLKILEGLRYLNGSKLASITNRK